MRVNRASPAATSSGPRVMGSRGPIREASRPALADSSSMITVIGTRATPEASGE